ncbi:MAG: hypothetical protein E2O68_08770 [Deltaproteobacteria bacterium]|nr:MAG: hypothetical protein E2O68_08770 [Deltaproteobacteria bacterium]
MRYTIHIFFTLSLILGCTPKQKSGGERKPASQEFVFLSNDKLLQSQILDFGEKFDRNLRTLPTRGELAKKPWTGDYWATWSGGISYRWFTDKDFRENIPNYRATCPFDPKDPARWGYRLMDMKNIPAGFNLACLSPAEKFDLFMEDENWTLTKIERQRTRILKTVPGSLVYEKGYKIPKWEGLCHAWAPLTYSFDEPKSLLVTNYKGRQIPFGSSDLKALMAFGVSHQDPIIPRLQSKSEFVGRRCDLKQYKKALDEGRISRNSYIKHLVESCEQSVNPAAFHIIITNMIGLRGESFIIDKTWDDEVWNQPLYYYDYETRPYKARIPEGSPMETASFVHVKMKVKMVGERPSTWKGGPLIEINPKYKKWKYKVHLSDPSFEDRWKTMAYRLETEDNILWWERDRQKTKEELREEYEYILALDFNGNIIGGKWFGKSEKRHPDFIWKQTVISPFEGILQRLGPLYQKSMNQQITALKQFENKVRKIQKYPMRFLMLYKKLFGDKHLFSLYLHNEIIGSFNEERKPNMLKIHFWIRHGADADKFEFLVIAIKTKQISLLKLLLKKSTKYNDPALMEIAATVGDIDIVKLLLKKKVPISIVAVKNSILQGNAKILKVLLNKSKIDPNTLVFRNEEGATPYEVPAIHQAAFSGNAEIIKVLLKRGGNKLINDVVKGSISGEGDNALIFTLRGLSLERNPPTADTLEIIRLLHGAGGDLHFRNKNYYNLKAVSSRLGGPFGALITKYLIENGVKN